VEWLLRRIPRVRGSPGPADGTPPPALRLPKPAMFVDTRMEDHVEVEPQHMGMPLSQALAQDIRKRYIDKIIPDVGLAMELKAILSVDGGFIHPGQGSAHYEVVFVLKVFKPAVGQVLEGTLASCNEQGLSISMDFFDDIHVPAHRLPQPSRYDREEGVWIWEYDGAEGQPFYIDLNQKVRFRVQSVRFNTQPPKIDLRDARKPTAAIEAAGSKAPLVADQVVERIPDGSVTRPPGPSGTFSDVGAAAVKAEPGGSTAALGPEAAPQLSAMELAFVPMVIIGSMKEDKLGLVDWWPEADEGG